MLFEDLGLKYLGPVDGHDEHAVEYALRRARDFGGPVLVHVITRKGFGYPLAEQNDEDCLHQVSPSARASVPAAASAAAAPAAGRPWTQVFGDELAAIGAERPDVVAITAAMLHPTGLAKFAAAYPDRVFDVGIAEQHAVTSAAGLALGGMHPVAAIYATFLNRAFDQVLMDVALHRLPVTFVLDRAGVTGPDGASHHGMWDGSILQLVPGLRIAVPQRWHQDGRAAARGGGDRRRPDGAAVPRSAGDRRCPGGRQARQHGRASECPPIRRAAMSCCSAPGRWPGSAPRRLTGSPTTASAVTVVDPRWVKPLDLALLDAARQHGLVVHGRGQRPGGRLR